MQVLTSSQRWLKVSRYIHLRQRASIVPICFHSHYIRLVVVSVKCYIINNDRTKTDQKKKEAENNNSNNQLGFRRNHSEIRSKNDDLNMVFILYFTNFIYDGDGLFER